MGVRVGAGRGQAGHLGGLGGHLERVIHDRLLGHTSVVAYSFWLKVANCKNYILLIHDKHQ